MKVGIYAGSFQPFHKGHMNILEKAERIFDDVIIAIGRNPDKSQMDRDEIEENLPEGRNTIFYEGLLTDLIIKLEGDLEEAEITLIRGLRDDMDLKYEAKQLQVMLDMKPDLKHILILCDRDFNHISSSMIRQLRSFSEDDARQYLIGGKA